MIVNEFIPDKEARELKELGFDEPCLARYEKWKDIFNKLDHSLHIIPPNSVSQNTPWDGQYSYCLALTWRQAFKFFRDKHNLEAHIYSCASGYLYEFSDTTGTHIYDSGFDGPNLGGCWDSYDEAELACLQKLIEIAKR